MCRNKQKKKMSPLVSSHDDSRRQLTKIQKYEKEKNMRLLRNPRSSYRGFYLGILAENNISASKSKSQYYYYYYYYYYR